MKQHIQRFQSNNEYYFVEGCYINELSNQSEDPELSIAQARVEPGVTTQWHQLRETTERYGAVEIGDHVPQTVKPGDVVIIPPNTRQRITNISSKDLIFLALCTPRFEVENYQSDLT
jgi:quercetin dioxygenase-like cupin family protein